MMNQDEALQAQLKRAAHFFKHDYQDRGMVKWQGFFLSDHTADVASYSNNRAKNIARQDQQEMTQEAIGRYLMKAFDQHFPVTLQLRNHNDEGVVSPFYHGKVLGFQDDDVILSGHQRRFPMCDILYVARH
ncbi:hypothetical protein [Weissella paramesenteroides]|uniref:hypothetical protein n=1 Tax=Weissella paramesenteroides TaxID=1249 RepID=UPI001040A76D|nr:hypothetical protein [Weissella paramesenteroides]RZQ58128.1 hypothetical protein EWR19_03285 [Weissella paramesenteroides]